MEEGGEGKQRRYERKIKERSGKGRKRAVEEGEEGNKGGMRENPLGKGRKGAVEEVG